MPPAIWTRRPCGSSTEVRRRKAFRAECLQEARERGWTCHASLSSEPSCIALFSTDTQCQALAQPMHKPATRSVSVHEWAPARCLSNQTPSITPSSVGAVTDQPMSPNTPSPDHAPCLPLRWALSLRRTFASTVRRKAFSSLERWLVRSPSTFELRDSADKAAFNLGDRGTNASFLRVKREKFAFHRLAQLREIRSPYRAANRDEHIGAGFHQHTFVDREVNCSLVCGFIGQNARGQDRDAVEPVGQEPDLAFGSLSDNARHACLVREDSRGQEDLKVHGRPPARFWLGATRLWPHRLARSCRAHSPGNSRTRRAESAHSRRVSL